MAKAGFTLLSTSRVLLYLSRKTTETVLGVPAFVTRRPLPESEDQSALASVLDDTVTTASVGELELRPAALEETANGMDVPELAILMPNT
jgi:hypothetical protein